MSKIGVYICGGCEIGQAAFVGHEPQRRCAPRQRLAVGLGRLDGALLGAAGDRDRREREDQRPGRQDAAMAWHGRDLRGDEGEGMRGEGMRG